MVAAFKGVGAASDFTSATTVNPALPTGGGAPAAGDIIEVLVYLRHEGAVDNTITVTDYTFIARSSLVHTQTDSNLYLFRKVAGGSESAPTINLPGTSNMGIAFTLVSEGIDGTTPADATAVSSSSAAADQWAPTGITTATDGALVYSFVGTRDDNALALLAGSEQGFTLRAGGAAYDSNLAQDGAAGLASELQGSAGAVTCPTWDQTAGTTVEWVGLTWALRADIGGASGGSTSSVNVAATGAGSGARAGGDEATVEVDGTGAGNKTALGGADAGVNVIATGAGSGARAGGDEATVEVDGTGAGNKTALGGADAGVNVIATGAGEAGEGEPTGGSTATVEVSGSGAGNKTALGGADAGVNVIATGAGTKAASGAGEADVEVEATGAGEGFTPIEGGSTATVEVDGSGAGSGARAGGATSSVNVVATGDGVAGDTVGGGAPATVEVDGSGAGSGARAGGATSSVNVVATGGRKFADVGQPLEWLGGKIDVRVEVDTGLTEAFGATWDSGLWGSGEWGAIDPVFQDITQYVRGVTLNGGKSRWEDRFVAGSATIELDNESGLFTPDPPVAVPWVLPWRPGRKIRVVVIPDPDTGVKVPLFTGTIENPNVVFGEAGYEVVAIVSALDYMATLAANNPPAGSPTGTQLTSERVTAALDNAEWPALERDIQVGKHSVASADLAQTTLEECQRAADAEGGAFFTDAGGRAVFKSRDWLADDARSVTVQGYVGHDPISVPEAAQVAHVIAVETSWELSRVRNDIQFARAGGILQRVTDATSKADYGGLWRTYQRTDLHNISDSQVRLLALRYLEVSKTDRLRIDRVTLAANKDPDNDDLNRLFWTTEYGDRLSVHIATAYGWAIESEVHVVGIRHEITPDDWLVTLAVDDAATFIPELTYWELGVEGRSELSNTTILSPTP